MRHALCLSVMTLSASLTSGSHSDSNPHEPAEDMALEARAFRAAAAPPPHAREGGGGG